MHGKEHKPALLWKRVDCCHCVSVHKSNISLFCARYCAVFFIWSPFAEIALRWRWSSGFGHVLCYLRLKRLRLSALSKPTTEITGNRFHSFNDAGGSGATVNASASACSLPSVVRSSGKTRRIAVRRNIPRKTLKSQQAFAIQTFSAASSALRISAARVRNNCTQTWTIVLFSCPGLLSFVDSVMTRLVYGKCAKYKNALVCIVSLADDLVARLP